MTAISTQTNGKAVNKIEMTPIRGVNHVFLIDWNDDGIQQEIAVLKVGADGTVYGIEVDKLHAIDRKRLKRFIASVHSDKYELWDLLSQGKLTNGMNALDFFHKNYMREKRPKGAIMGGMYTSLSTSLVDTDLSGVDDGVMIGAGFTNPGAAMVADGSEYGASTLR